MITHIAAVGVYVGDQEQALDFYVTKLGFEKRADEPMGDGQRWLEVPRQEQRRAWSCHVRRRRRALTKSASFPALSSSPTTSTPPTKSFPRGIEFIERTTDQPRGGRQALVKDQDGNTFVLFQR